MKELLYAGYLINSASSLSAISDCKVKGVDTNVILSILKQNKVPLIFFDQKQKETYPEFFDNSVFKLSYESEQALFSNLRDEWAKVREEFLKVGIESMFIKSVGFFDYKSSNLDILIKQKKREEAESILKKMGYIQLHNVQEPYKTLFRRFSGSKSMSVIHLHNKVAWINPFHDEKLLWNRFQHSSKDNLVDIPSPEDSILILTAHWFYEDKEIKLSDIMKISVCLKNEDLDWDYITNVAREFGWLNGLYCALIVQSFLEKALYGKSVIQDDRLKDMKVALPWWMKIYLNKSIYSNEIVLPFKLSKIFGKYLHFVKTVQDKSITNFVKLRESWVILRASIFVVLFYKLNINIRYQPSMLISISGVDGSGKSTYAKILHETLIFCELKTRYVWSRVGSSNFLAPLSKVAKIFYRIKRGKSIKTDDESLTESDERRKDMFGKSYMMKVIGLSILLLEMLWHYSTKISLPLLFNKVVLCDRYIYDTFVDISTRYSTSLSSIEGKIFIRILTALVPKPDISYLLVVSPEDACSRKGVDIDEKNLVQDQINLYRDIVPNFNFHQIGANNDTNISNISDQMINEMLLNYYKKWPKKNK